ncbi:MAG: DNA repair protein RadA [Candidatus Omnitrophica bacterium]|nr:DNA repair protein RadA [Candidatus Omnitrophota bacterium]
MAKEKTMFVCQECGSQSPRWVGKCPGCDGWNTLVEEKTRPAAKKHSHLVSDSKPVVLSQVSTQDEVRYVTGIKEFDNVMGSGIVLGSVTLIGGDPGIGKSTLSLQVSCALSQKGYKVLYVTGEESIRQTSLRAERLTSKAADNLYLVSQVDLSVILSHIEQFSPEVVVIDSIQVVYTSDILSSPGSVSQVRECAAILTHLAKAKGIALFLIGHVTKEGAIAGPRVLEHIVDTVLYFEGDRYSSYRILRGTKNRFGSTNEIGVFEMTGAGLKEVDNPSEIFLAERPVDSSGSVVVPIVEGTRPFLVEVQGLVSRSAFGMVRQKAQGFDANRLALLIAVLEKRMGLNLQDKDVFVNVVGGVKLIDPAADLAVVVSVASALLDKPVPYDTVFIGEVGLAAEVRSVSQISSRIKEAEKLGFKRCVLPKNNLKAGTDIKTKLNIIAVENVRQALDVLKGADK